MIASPGRFPKPRFIVVSVALLCLLAAPGLARKKKQTLVGMAAAKVEEALVRPPQDNEICFSPVESCDVKLWKFIQSAQKSLDVALFDITHPKVVHEILVASKRIPVRVVVDKRQARGEHSLVELLIKGGANVKYGRQRGIMHNKFTIVDNARLETGSFNYTNHATEANNENQIYLGTPAVVERYHARFEEIWREATDAPKPEVAVKGD